MLIVLIAGTFYTVYTRRSTTPTTDSEETKVWPAQSVQRCQGAVFGTFYHITYRHSDNLQPNIEATLAKVDASLSPFNKLSTITAINNNDDMRVDTMLTEVFTLAQNVSAETDGAFDITVAPLVNLWGFGFKHMNSVNQQKVDSLLQFVGYKKVQLRQGEIHKERPEILLDCSAIAKGYGVDAVGKCLESLGVKHYMVEIGGEVRVRGYNPRGELWRIGINKPDDNPQQANNDIEQVVQASNLSMATSGNYRNYYEKDGKKYAHTIDPRTGNPVQHNILSSTVLTQDCATADAYATAFMVLGLDEAKAVLDKHPELMAFFIYNDDEGNVKEWYTDNLRAMIAQ